MGFYDDPYPFELLINETVINTEGWKHDEFVKLANELRKTTTGKIIIKAKYKGYSTLDYPATPYETWRNLSIDDSLFLN